MREAAEKLLRPGDLTHRRGFLVVGAVLDNECDPVFSRSHLTCRRLAGRFDDRAAGNGEEGETALELRGHRHPRDDGLAFGRTLDEQPLEDEDLLFGEKLGVPVRAEKAADALELPSLAEQVACKLQLAVPVPAQREHLAD